MNLPRLSWSTVFKALFMCGLLLPLGLSVLLWYVTTDSFQQMARNRVVAGLERATGGKDELGIFHAVPLRRQVAVRDLTIHGKEAAKVELGPFHAVPLRRQVEVRDLTIHGK